MAETVARVAHIWLVATDLFERLYYVAAERIFRPHNAADRSKSET